MTVLLATALVLLATPVSNRRCNHADQTVPYAVTGSCGSDAVIEIFSGENLCGVFMNVISGDPRLPVEGELGADFDIRHGDWALHGFIPNRSSDGGMPGAVDAGTRLSSRRCQASRVDEAHLLLTCDATDGPTTESVSSSSGQPEATAGRCEAALTEIVEGAQ
ncbi:MAG: hypothetical protein AB2A00_25605 [Myxococcota bacterium]